MAGRAGVGPQERGHGVSSILRGVARRQGSPYTGKCSARPAGKPGDSRIVKGAFATFPSSPLDSRSYQRTTTTGRPICVFKAWRNLSHRCGLSQNQKPNPSRDRPPPAGRPRPRVEERDGRTTPFSSSAMSSGRLFLERVARQQSPSPLHRHPQINMHFSGARRKGDISTLPGRGHFYFALTGALEQLDKGSGVSNNWSRIPCDGETFLRSVAAPRWVYIHRVSAMPVPFEDEKSNLKITGVRLVRTRPKRPVPAYQPAAGSWSTAGWKWPTQCRYIRSTRRSGRCSCRIPANWKGSRWRSRPIRA